MTVQGVKMFYRNILCMPLQQRAYTGLQIKSGNEAGHPAEAGKQHKPAVQQEPVIVMDVFNV